MRFATSVNVGIRAVARGGALAATIWFASAPALATPSTKAQCIEANTEGQDLRRDGKLAAAREQLRKCADAACPEVIRDDCTQRLDELEKAQPTILFEVKDGAGRDLTGVRVTMDGRLLAERLEGAAIPVEPGDHTFRFEAAGQPPAESTLVVRETEKNRLEAVVMGEMPSPHPAPAAGSPATAPPSAPLHAGPAAAAAETAGGGWSRMRTIGVVVGGVGVAGLIAGAIFGVEALSTKGAHCDPDGLCDRGSAATADLQATVSTVGFIGGGIMAGAGAALFLLAPSGSSEGSAARVAVKPLVGLASGGLQVAGTW